MTLDELIGTWEIVSYTLTRDDGTTFYPLGENCKAYLIYTADGHVSAQMSAMGRPAYASHDLHDGTVEEMAAAAHGYMAYCGTYTLDLEHSNIIHNIEISMNPTWENQSQVRHISYDGEFLTITADVNTARLVWRKTK
ncbi:lipocalin-like domain-containing protein [Bifidobacterium vansinderenii]|uniref:Lipocalin-like domain-containing protein n=1 Tax=Bifidobacterium vansinderenii TaxID=1984871 RepID=A0A229VVI6_9BIFI|nr:lipocalin-like domain-containing protein [Bifidobacterium vansinderenii]OXM99634.1 Lipocalin-like domain-containing protein [Bifidobacterium vansinderenii]